MAEKRFWKLGWSSARSRFWLREDSSGSAACSSELWVSPWRQRASSYTKLSACWRVRTPQQGEDRESVGEGKRVDLGGCRIIKKKKKKKVSESGNIKRDYEQLA